MDENLFNVLKRLKFYRGKMDVLDLLDERYDVYSISEIEDEGIRQDLLENNDEIYSRDQKMYLANCMVLDEILESEKYSDYNLFECDEDKIISLIAEEGNGWTKTRIRRALDAYKRYGVLARIQQNEFNDSIGALLGNISFKLSLEDLEVDIFVLDEIRASVYAKDEINEEIALELNELFDSETQDLMVENHEEAKIRVYNL